MSRSKKQRHAPAPQPPMDRATLRTRLAAIRDETPEPEVDALVRQVAERAENPGGELAALAAYDLDPRVSQTAALFLFRLLEAATAGPAAKAATAQAATPVLLQALRDPALPDDRKLALPTLCHLAGHELSLDELHACFKDFEAATHRSMSDMTANFSDQPEGVVKLLAGFHLWTDDNAAPSEDACGSTFVCCAATRESSPSLAASALAAVVAIAAEHGAFTEHRDAVLDALAEIRSERGAWCLAELGRWPGLGALGARARALAAQLAAEGVAPRFTLLADFSHGLVSATDGAGMRSLGLFFRTPEGGLDALLLLLSDSLGLKDVTYLPEEGSDLEDRLRHAPHDIPSAPCPLDLARAIVAHAWAIGQERQRPFPGQFFVVRPYLGSAAILPARRTPNLGAYMLETMVRSPELVRDSQELLDAPAYRSLWFSSDAAYEFLSGVAPKRGRRLPRKHLDAFARDIAIGERDTLLSRLAINIEVESLAGRATQPRNRIAARTWVAISESVVPFHEIPYVRGLCDASAEMITTNLDLGYRTQAEANQAALEMDDSFHRLVDGFLGEFDDGFEDGEEDG